MALAPSLQAGSLFGQYCFSNDSKYIICCCGDSLKVFNTTNGELLHNLRGHIKTVTGVVLNPSNVLQIFSCGQDGMLISWDYLDGVRLKQYDLHMALYGIISINAEKKSIMMLSQTTEHKKTFCLMQWKKKKASNDYSKPKMLIEKCDGDPRLVSFGCLREYVASGLKHTLAIYSMKKGSTKFVSDHDKFNKNKAITCVACHPTEYCIATGLENGKILLWNNFFKDSHPVISVMHWHSLPVSSIEFTPNGSNLLSGGLECVLVRWQMGNPNQRDYKPRMGAPVSEVIISPDGNYFATRHADNSIQLLDINLKVLQVYRGMTRTNFCRTLDKSPISSGLKYDPRSRTIVTNGLPGHLQFFSLSLNKQLFNLDIVGQNYISPENLEQPKAITEIMCTAISGDGQWLATFEMWDDSQFTPELRLKFWSYSSEAQTYSLNTTVEYPHDLKITSMLFRPITQKKSIFDAPSLVSVGEDQCFKIWTLVDDSDIYRVNTRWNCESVGFYRGLNVHCVDFSTDGSTLAVGFEHLITIWDPDTSVVHTTLSNCLNERDPIIHLKFGSHGSCHHLISASAKMLISRDLLTLTVLWVIKENVTLLFRDPSSDLMGYVSNNQTLCVFRPSHEEIVYKHANISCADIVDAIFVPGGRQDDLVNVGWPGSSQIYLFNTEQQLITLDLERNTRDHKEKMIIVQNIPQSNLRIMMAEKLVRETKPLEHKETAGKTKLPEDSFASLFLHSNEPVSLFCDQYLNSLLVKKKLKHKKEKEDSDDSSSEEESSNSESEMQVDKQEFNKTKRARLAYDMTDSRKEEPENDMNKLLSSKTDWVKWCSSLSLK